MTRRAARLAIGTAMAALLCACASGPNTRESDGPEAKPPPNLLSVPDATPQFEPIRDGGPNKPYAIAGHTYVPLSSDKAVHESGLASWYGRKFNGKPTANGEPYDMYAMSAAHRTLPIPSYARVRNPANGREVIVRINDRGPFHRDRVIDLSYTAALKLGVLGGVAPVEVERITNEQIRSGEWRRNGASAAMPESVAPTVEVLASAASPGAPTPASAAVAPAPPTPVLTPTMSVASAPTTPTAHAAPRPLTQPAVAPEPLPPPASVATTAAAEGGFWVQLGAFRQRDGAEQFQRRVADELAWLSPLLAVTAEQSIYRLQAGPYATRSDAQDAARRIREALKLVPVVVERR